MPICWIFLPVARAPHPELPDLDIVLDTAVIMCVKLYPHTDVKTSLQLLRHSLIKYCGPYKVMRDFHEVIAPSRVFDIYLPIPMHKNVEEGKILVMGPGEGYEVVLGLSENCEGQGLAAMLCVTSTSEKQVQ